MAKSKSGSSGSLASRAGAQRWRQGISLAFFGMVSLLLGWTLLDDLGLIWTGTALRTFDGLPFVLAGAGALIGITRASRVLHVATFLIIVLWLVVGYSPLAGRMYRSLAVTPYTGSADAAVVLASHIQGDDELSDEARARLLRGIELCRQKVVPRLVLTEMQRPEGSHAVAAGDLLRALGIECPMDSVGPIVNTHDEAVAVVRLARDRGWKRLLIVTSPVHARRALLVFRKAARGSAVDFQPAPCDEGSYDPNRLDHAFDRRSAFHHAVHELLGTWVYRLRGWI